MRKNDRKYYKYRGLKMIILINLIILLIYILLFIISKLHLIKNNYNLEIDKSKSQFRFMYPLSLFIIHKLKLYNKLFENVNLKEELSAIYVSLDVKNLMFIRFLEKLSMTLFIIFIFNLLSMTCGIMELKDVQLIDGKYIERPAYNEGSKELELDVYTTEDNTLIKDNIKISIDERRYNKNEIDKLFEEAKDYINDKLILNNNSLDEIVTNIKLIKSIPNKNITIKWTLDEDLIINNDGSLNNENISKDGKLVTIWANIKYYDESILYPVHLKVYPLILSKKEQLIKDIKDEINTKNTKDYNKKYIELPKDIKGQNILFKEKSKSNASLLLILGVFTSIVIYFNFDKQLNSKLKKREYELLIDYPELISKFTLLLNSGMTVKGTWEKIVTEYNYNLERNIIKKRYLYEEMLITWHEIELGNSEIKAIERFGRRIKLLPYMKFCSYVVQNMQKGSKGLIDLLEVEANEAFEERKQLAKRLGEEAGTKLLLPMMIMLVIVIVIIIIPAFSSFGI